MILNQEKASASSTDLATYFRSMGEEALLTADDERRLVAAIARLEESRSSFALADLRVSAHDGRGPIRAIEDCDRPHAVRSGAGRAAGAGQAIRPTLNDATPTIRIPAQVAGLLNRRRRVVRKSAAAG